MAVHKPTAQARIPKVRVSRPADRTWQIRYTDLVTKKEVRIPLGCRDEKIAQQKMAEVRAKLTLGQAPRLESSWRSTIACENQSRKDVQVLLCVPLFERRGKCVERVFSTRPMLSMATVSGNSRPVLLDFCRLITRFSVH